MKRLLCVVLCITMLCLLSACGSEHKEYYSGGQSGNSSGTETVVTEEKTVKFAVMTDVHYITEPTDIDRANVEEYERTEDRLLVAMDKIVDKALSNAIAENPDGLIICGDITSNGERENAEAIASKLDGVSDKFPAGIYVTNGNHDLNNSHAVKFENGEKHDAERMDTEDFKSIFAKFGLNENSRFFGGEASAKTGNSGALSYATEISDGITLIVMDTNTYSVDKNAHYDDAQMTGGAISKELLAWAKAEAESAAKKGNLVLGMCHHSIITHYGVENDTIKFYESNFVLENRKEVAETLADAGVCAVLTGHAHSNDIAAYTSEKGNTIYDISTAALCAYPCNYRTLEIKMEKTGEETKYTISTDVRFVENVEGYELKIGETTYDNLQDYSYYKTGLNTRSLKYTVKFFVQQLLYEIKNFDSAEFGKGIRGYVKEKIDTQESVGDYVTMLIKVLLMKYLPLETSLDLGAFGTSLGISSEVKISLGLADTSEDPYKIPATVTYSVDDEGTKREIAEKGTIKIDVAALGSSVETLLDKLQDILDNNDFTANSEVALLKDISDFAELLLSGALNAKLDGDVTAMTIAEDAYQAHALGSEMLAEDGAAYEKRLEYTKLLTGETLQKAVLNAVFTALGYLRDYSTLAFIYDLPIAEGDVVIGFEKDETTVTPAFPEGSANPFSIMGLTDTIITLIQFKTVGQALTTVGTLQRMADLIPSSLIAPLMAKLAEVQVAFVTDNNVLDDSKLEFEYKAA